MKLMEGLMLDHRLQQAAIYLDEHPVYNIAFKEDFGKVAGLVYNFAGIGAVDHVRLQNGAGKVAYEDAFEQ